MRRPGANRRRPEDVLRLRTDPNFREAWRRVTERCFAPTPFKARTLARLRDVLKHHGHLHPSRAAALARRLWEAGVVVV